MEHNAGASQQDNTYVQRRCAHWLFCVTMFILLIAAIVLAVYKDSTRQILLLYFLPAYGGGFLMYILAFYRHRLLPCCCEQRKTISPLPYDIIKTKTGSTRSTGNTSLITVPSDLTSNPLIATFPSWIKAPSVGIRGSFDTIRDHIAGMMKLGVSCKPSTNAASCRKLELTCSEPLPIPGIIEHTVPIQDIENGESIPVIDMSGVFVLIHSFNFDEFLKSQGVPWPIRKAVKMSKPVHTLTHVSNSIRIQVDGVTKGDVTYVIEGDPVTSKIRHLTFLDHVSYLEEGDGIQIRKINTSTVQSPNGATEMIVTRRIVEGGTKMLLSTIAVFPDGRDSIESVQTFQRCC